MATSDATPCPRCVILEKEIEGLRREVEQLKVLIEDLRRQKKRQAAPFSRGAPVLDPKRPGRKPGAGYGRQAFRPAPEVVDEVIAAPAPRVCPGCGGEVVVEDVQPQWETDLPQPRPHVTRFDVEVGRCGSCRKQVRGVHPRQTTQAAGAAASHLGPNARALAVELHHGLGLSYGKVARLFDEAFALHVTPGALVQTLARTARDLEPAHAVLLGQLQRSKVISPDETGWRVGGLGAWLWVFATPDLAVYGITPGRGFEDACTILPESYDGTLVRDGWAPYRQYENADHQTCLAHIARRVRELLELARSGSARVPHALRRLLRRAFLLRDRRDAGLLCAPGLRVAVGQLDAALNRLVACSPTVDENRRLLKHVGEQHQLGAVTRFLLDPEIPATNHWSEQALRPAVVNRKVWGGNRTWRGAEAQEVLMSVSITLRKRGSVPWPVVATGMTLGGRDHVPKLLAATGPP